MIKAFLLAAALAVPSFAAPKAPDFKIARVLNAPVSELKGLAGLKGKVVYLEFWATWCAPCVAGIPHMNRLVDAFKGEPVVFLSVTDEPAAKIEAFIKTHEMKAWVGVEAESAVKAYGVESRPAGFLIGKDGTFLAEISPQQLTEQELRDALAGTFAPRRLPKR
ncbi:MAG: TlpA family protein disulfide reductase [Elusimicrobiota bacterium]